MEDFTAHRLEFTLAAIDPVMLPAPAGAALRGALFEALWTSFCVNKAAPTCAACPLVATCAVALLVATMEPSPRTRAVFAPVGNTDTPVDGDLASWSERSPLPARDPPPVPTATSLSLNRYLQALPTGGQLPRPYTVEPPLGPSHRYAPGERISFGLTLFASAHQLFPYIVLAVQRHWSQRGIGVRQSARGGGQRGRVQLVEVTARHPLDGTCQLVWQRGSDVIHLPALPVTEAQVAAYTQSWPLATGAIGLHFRTPTRLVAAGRLVRHPEPAVLMARLLERLSALSRTFAGTVLLTDPRPVLTQAAVVRVVDDRTRWVEGWSPSRRLRRSTPLGGFAGQAVWEAEPTTLATLLPWLVWGSISHVGKDAVKGNGWFDVLRLDCARPVQCPS